MYNSRKTKSFYNMQKGNGFFGDLAKNIAPKVLNQVSQRAENFIKSKLESKKKIPENKKLLDLLERQNTYGSGLKTFKK